MSKSAPVGPDYELEDWLEVTQPEQFKALGDPLRQKILGLLLERAATTSQLASALGTPPGTMGHHLHVLADAELIRVVRTRPVRAMTEKYYGRVARSFFTHSADERLRLLQQAMREAVAPPGPDLLPLYVLRHARIPERHAREFAERLLELSREFADRACPGEQVYGFLGSVYLTDWPQLPEREQS